MVVRSLISVAPVYSAPVPHVMVKKKFGGSKVDVKAVVEEPAPVKATEVAWAKGPSAAVARQGSSVASAKPKAGGSWAQGAGAAGTSSGAKPCGVMAVGPSSSWDKGGPKGLAATAASVSAKAGAGRPAQIAAGGRPPASSVFGNRRGQAAPPSMFDADAFTDEGLKSVATIAQEKAAAATAAAFPQTSNPEEALAALCRCAEATGLTVSSDVASRLSAGFRWLLASLSEAPAEARDRMLSAGACLILQAESQHIPLIQAALDEYFAGQQAKSTPQATEANGLVDAILYGSLAQVSEGQAAAIRVRLVRRLTKPSTSVSVQNSLVEALVPLMSPEVAEETCKNFMQAMDKDSARRGSVLGMAAAVRAAGVGSVRKFGVIDWIKGSLGDKNASKRQAGLICLEALATGLGRQFEPYSISLMPQLLASCADSAKDVQLAGRSATQAVVLQLSANGMKLLVKPLLEGLSDGRWRTQLSAIELLPPIVSGLADSSRLATVLPKVVPPLCEASLSTRGEIRGAAKEVFEQIAACIQHLDFAPLAPTLVSALVDPLDGPVGKALDTLITAVFTTAIDAPSCALVCPIVTRALRGDIDRRRKGAQFIRTIVQLIGQDEELYPYLTSLWPNLQASLADVHPEVRFASAHALGALVESLGDELDWSSFLLNRLNTSREESELEGAGLGFAVALATVSLERRVELLEEVLSGDPVDGRQGRLAVCFFLPKVFAAVPGGSDVVATMLPVLEVALADPDEKLRASARRGLEAVVAATNDSSDALIVGSLRRSLRTPDARVRVTACEVSYQLIQQRPKAAVIRTELVTAVLVAQADDVGEVRKSAERAWRAAIETGDAASKQLKVLRPTLLDQVSEDWACGVEHVAANAGRAAAQLVSRFDVGVLDDLAPRVRDALSSSNTTVQRFALGALLGILQAGHDLHMSWNRSVLQALGSPDDDVRSAAAKCALAAPQSLVEPVVRDLCAFDDEPTADDLACLEALFMADRSCVVFPVLADHCTEPYTMAKVACLATVVAAPEAALQESATTVVSVCLRVIASSAQISDVALSVVERLAIRLQTSSVIDDVLSMLDLGRKDRHAEACARVLAALLEGVPVDPVPEGLVEVLVPGALLTADVVRRQAFAGALKVLVKRGVPVQTFVGPLHDELDSVTEVVPDFVDAVVLLTLPGITGSVPLRKTFAQVLAGTLRLSDAATLRSHAVKCCGVLVRALGDKANSDGEFLCATLASLEVFLTHASTELRPLAAPLQTVLMRLLDGPEQSAVVRVIVALVPASARPEAFVKLLCKTPKVATLNALSGICSAGHLRSVDVTSDLRAAAEAGTSHADEEVRSAAQRLLSVM